MQRSGERHFQTERMATARTPRYSMPGLLKRKQRGHCGWSRVNRGVGSGKRWSWRIGRNQIIQSLASHGEAIGFYSKWDGKHYRGVWGGGLCTREFSMQSCLFTLFVGFKGKLTYSELLLVEHILSCKLNRNPLELSTRYLNMKYAARWQNLSVCV